VNRRGGDISCKQVMQTTRIVRLPDVQLLIIKRTRIPRTAQSVDIHTHTHIYIYSLPSILPGAPSLGQKHKNKSRGVQGGGEERHKRQRLESVKPMEAWKTGICSETGLAWKHTGATECDCG